MLIFKTLLHQIIFTLALLVMSGPLCAADTRLTILHTSDIHGHFSNSDSPLRLGGVARLKTKIDEIKKRNANHLLLDSGDWTEGTIFYTLNSGEANHRLMESFDYDAIVLGNHEWLVGPKDLYEGFVAADFKVPVLSANTDFSKVPADINLKKYISPYVVKEVGGKRIGILGLSTFELIYDSFFEPAQLMEPTRIALKYVKKLRQEEKCDVVILLTHLGLHSDKKIAESVPGINLIVGGHTHILLEKPIVVNNVPIVHVGYWAQYLGEYELLINQDGKTELVRHKIHQIDPTTPENILTAALVEGFQKRIEDIRGKIFNDNIFKSQVNLPLGKGITEETLGNWATDALRVSGKTNLAVDVGQYFRRDIFAGFSSTVDFYNMFPHVYNKDKNKNWTIFNMDVKGSTLEQLINVFVKLGLGVKVSNASYQIDYDENLFSVKELVANKKEISTSQYYTISATEGILTAFEGLKKVGADVGVKNVKNTNVEAWQAIKNFVVAKSPLTAKDTKWEGRVRTVQPDIHVPLEQLVVERVDEKTVRVDYTVINAGMKRALYPTTIVTLDTTPKNTLDDKWIKMEELKPAGVTYLRPGQIISKSVLIRSPKDIPADIYPITVESSTFEEEYNLQNNKVIGYFSL